jgi:ubiquitin carboxyl-terminal hydrolase 5/13
MAQTALDAIRGGMAGLRAPGVGDKVYKMECVMSFDTPESPAGLFVNLRSFQAFGADYVSLDHELTGNTLYLHQSWTRIPKESSEEKDTTGDGSAASKLTRVAIGMEGGAALEDDFEWEKLHRVVAFPSRLSVEYPSEVLPEFVSTVVDAVLRHDDASKVAEVKAAAWEFVAEPSKYADALIQLEPQGRHISPDPKTWKCVHCDLRENL